MPKMGDRFAFWLVIVSIVLVSGAACACGYVIYRLLLAAL